MDGTEKGSQSLRPGTKERNSSQGFSPRAAFYRIDGESKRKANGVSEKDSMQSAADEARTVARAAREFGRFLDDYAKLLTQPTRRDQAAEMHIAAMRKLDAINAGLVVCSNWVLESGKIPVAARADEPITALPSETPKDIEPSEPRGVRVRKKGTTN